LLENIQEAREDHNDELQVEGIVVNQFQPRARLPQELVASLEEEGLPMLKSKLSASVVMRESHEQATPLVNMQPKHKLTEEYRSLFKELNGR
ncbi:MAG: ParA family protein, partial [Pseudomonadota bacterium]|nr:ParA family protein [Pseudomonadota bacterium]